MIYLLSDKEHKEAKSLKTIEICFVDKAISLEGFEAIVFTSKNSVEALERVGCDWKNIPSYAIGEGTALHVKKCEGNLVYTAESAYGDDFAKEIASLLVGKKVFFPRAKEVLSKFNTILTSFGVNLFELVVYETTCRDCDAIKAPEDGAILIFTSPSTIKCFLKCFKWNESYRAVCIGTKTATYLPSGVKSHISSIQTIDACIELAKKL
ncbi:MAG: uroporphyrinogen-III synthase [Sulfurospirillaceae bacterium]|nr:uroporphyrinogen-III synthase [Sulfurospirillaceae bacterium]